MRSDPSREELDRAAAVSVRPLAAALALAYAALAAARVGMPDHPGHEVHLPLAVGSVVVLLGALVVLGRRPLATRRVHLILAGVAALVLANAVVDLAVEGPDETVFFVLLVTGAGALLPSRRRLAAVLGLAWAGWLSVAAVRGGSDPGRWTEFGFFLLAATGLSLVLRRQRLRALAALAGERRRAARLIERSADLVAVVDAKGIVRYVSPSSATVLGIPPSELEGRRVLDLVHPDDVSEVRGRTVRGGQEAHEVRVRHRDGSWRILEVVATDASDDPAVRGLILNARDVTDRVRVDAERDETLARLTAIVDASPLAIVGMDTEGIVTTWNPAAERILGWTREEAVGRFLPHVGTEWAGEFRERRERLLAGEVTVLGEVLRRRKDWSEVWLSLTTAPIRDGSDRVVGFLSVLADLTARKEAEAALSRVEDRYRALVEQLPAVVYTWSASADGRSGTYSLTSPRIEEMLGYPAEEWDGQPGLWIERLHPDDRAAVLEATRRSASEGVPFEMEYRCIARDGREVWIHDRATLLRREEDGGTVVFQGVMLDVTERKRAEEGLREAEARYRSIFENAVEGIFRTSPDGRYLTANPALARMLGFDSPEELITMVADVGQLYADPEGRERFIREIEERGSLIDFEYEAVRRDGTRMWVSENVRVLRDEVGEVVGFEGTTLDVTERRRAEAALRESLERYRVLADEVPVGIFLTDREGRNVWMNERWSRITGLSADDGSGHGFARVLHPEDREGVMEAWGRAAASGDGFEREFRLLRPDGTVRWVFVRASPLREDDGSVRGHLGTVEDVTDRHVAEDVLRRSEAELRRSIEVLRREYEERRRTLALILEAQEEGFARVAEGIEDEQLQHVAALGIRLEALRRRATDAAQLEALAGLDVTVRGVAEGLRDLLSELRPRELETGGLAEAVRRTATSLLPGVAVAVEDRLGMEPEEAVRTTAFRLAQEALRNVRDHAEASRVLVGIDERAGGIHLEVRDDGRGFDVGSHVEGGGLTSMRERAELAGGRLRVTSLPGEGTTVTLWVPQRPPGDDPAPGGATRSLRPHPVPGGVG